MLLIHKLKSLEKQIVFLRWASGEAYGKLNYVGSDFIEFQVINASYDYTETILLKPAIILEVVIGGNSIGKVVAEVSHKLQTKEKN